MIKIKQNLSRNFPYLILCSKIYLKWDPEICLTFSLVLRM
jgi:hypothetical protein